MTEQALQPSVGISDKALRTVSTYAAIAGLMPLIPVPFIDDVLIERIHRGLYQKLCNQYDFFLKIDDVKRLTARQSNIISGVLKGAILYPIKKILRKVFYILAIKSCADVGAAVFHEGWLMARALEQDYISKDQLANGDEATIEKLGQAISDAHSRVDPKVTQQIMRTAFGVGRQVVRPIAKSLVSSVVKKSDDEFGEAEESAAPITKRIEQELRSHWHLSPQLDDALRKALDV